MATFQLGDHQTGSMKEMHSLNLDVLHLGVKDHLLFTAQILTSRKIWTLAWAGKPTDEKHQKMGMFDLGDHQTGSRKEIHSLNLDVLHLGVNGHPLPIDQI